MVAYSFQRRFIGQVLAGLEPGPWLPGMKRHTLRLPREGRSQHARPEQAVQLYTAMRTKQCRQLGRAVCRLQMPVVLQMTARGLCIARREGAAPRSKVVDLAPIVQLLLRHPAGWGLCHDQMDEFARTDGFAGADEMARYFEAPNASEVSGEGAMCLEMILIAWAPEAAA